MNPLNLPGSATAIYRFWLMSNMYISKGRRWKQGGLVAPGSHPRAEAQCLNYCIISAKLQCRKSGQVSSVQSGSVLWQQCEEAIKVSLASADISRQDITIAAVDSLWSPYVIGQTIIFLPCDFYLSIYLSSSFFSSPNLGGRRLDVYHTSTHGMALVRI